MGDTFGHLFKITTWGESHGKGVGVVIDGCPAGLEISEKDIQLELDRRKPGQSKITTQRKERDNAKILSGIFEGKTTGTAISIMVSNDDARPEAYEHLKNLYRPSHADYTFEAKYGIRDWMGGGRASARETIGRVAAGAIAKKLLFIWSGIETIAWVEQIQNLKANIDIEKVTRKKIESSIVRCPDENTSKLMENLVLDIRKKGDSVGGIIHAIAKNVPPGLGEPVFDKLTADLSKALISLPATRGIEFGLGFNSISLTGSQHNDPYLIKNGKVGTSKNNSAGIQGGISNGETIDLRVVFKPTATVNHEQNTISKSGDSIMLRAKGRHDPCVLPRAVPMVESMINLVLVDHYLRMQNNRLS